MQYFSEFHCLWEEKTDPFELKEYLKGRKQQQKPSSTWKLYFSVSSRDFT